VSVDWIQPAAELGYLVAAALFIFGLKQLGSPRTAVRGNQLGALGMLIAVVVTLLKIGAEEGILGGWLIVIGLLLGALIGAIMARRVQMTGMPELVALFNGFGGGASALVALSELIGSDPAKSNLGATVFLIAAGLTSIIGWVTLTGSVVAMLKLNGTLKGNVTFPGVNAVKALLLLIAGALIWHMAYGGGLWTVLGISLVAAVLGVLFVVPIGGADMPVVISFLNSLSGLAASTTGFVVDNNALIISGALVGAAGLILTAIMCKAMNRSFVDVMFKAYGAATGGGGGGGEKRTVRGRDADEAAVVFDGARSVIIVPGYGMAVSQSQHVVRELMEELEKRGSQVRFAIHPVAGRMPGHMNVLLAEANVPYEQLVELEDINSSFAECDVCLVVGANDTINPAAKTDPTGPLGGMPVLDVEKARTVLIVKRSLSPGYAGVDNELFYEPSTMMLFGDGKAMLNELLTAVKEL
jgi:proton-translocating NAD(P)+ transhydrogenase subunit beta